MQALTRVLKWNSAESSREVTVHISWPVQQKESWTCQWEIVWPDRRRSNAAHGIDAIQAIVSALQMVGSEIYSSDEHKSKKLSWARKWIGYGFPVPHNVRDILVGNDKTYF